MFTYTYGAITDRGDIRAENQDSILCLAENINNQPGAIFAIADGMGGLSYGAQVSRYITEQFKRWWYEDFTNMIQEGMENEDDIRELMEQEIWDINQVIVRFNHQYQCKSGSTLSLLLLYKGMYYIESLGDSRIYLLRNQHMEQLTKDQSLAALMMKHSCEAIDEKQYVRNKNKLTMCIGMFSIPQSDYNTGNVLNGDKFLLCSDGLYNQLKKWEMEAVLEENGRTADEKVKLLRQMIKPGEAWDNVSAIVMEIRE